MANEENSMYGLWKDVLEHQEEERRMRVDEFQVRYAERKQQKMERRRIVEEATKQICEIVVEQLAHPDNLTSEDLSYFSAALNSAASAMNTMEMYAEYTPMYSGGFCAV